MPEIDKPYRKFKRFHLNRIEDISGVSGTGIVAEGVVFSNNKVVITWTQSYHTSVSMYDSIADMEYIHGHEGRTAIEWIDE